MTDPLADILIDDLSGDQATTWEYGLVAAVTGMTVDVNISGGVINVPFAQSYDPALGDACILLRRGTRAVVIGATSKTTPMKGTITAVGTGEVTVTVNGVTGLKMKYLNWYTPTIGDSVWVTSGGVLGKFNTAPPAPPPPAEVPAPPPAPTTGTYTFAARDAATFRGTGWRTDTYGLYQGDWAGSGANNAAWFYGTAFQDALAGTTVTSITIWLNRSTGSGVYGPQDVHLYTHSETDRPGGNLGYGEGPQDYALAVGQSGWYALPTSWGQALVNGTRRGIGISGNPYLRLYGLAEDGTSGAIGIAWTT